MTFFHQQEGPAYFNEYDVKKAYWLRELMRQGHIAPGVIDTRSIEDVTPTELAGFVQHHFFAGIGVWSCAARLAGWPDDQPIRTLSCPCQPFSAAGQGAAFDDPRHLWPAACWHIEFGGVRPTFGEQVASSDGLNWLDLVSADLEAANHSIAVFDLCSAGVGSPNLRSRLYYAAEFSGVGGMDNSQQARLEGHAGHGGSERGRAESIGLASASSTSGVLVDTSRKRLGQVGSDGGRCDEGMRAEGRSPRPADECGLGDVADLHSDGRGEGWSGESSAGHDGLVRDGTARRLADAYRNESRSQRGDYGEVRRLQEEQRQSEHGSALLGRGGFDGNITPGPTNGFWRDADWIHCRPEPNFPNGRWRPVRPGSFPLAAGTPARMVRLRGYGDAINAEVAAKFIRAYREEKGLDITPFPFPWLEASYAS